MKGKHHQEQPISLAMRVYERVRAKHTRNADFLMCEVADGLIEEFGVSRATAFRYIRIAVDVLGISYDRTEGRTEKIGDRRSEGQARAKLTNFPNGRPGPRALVHASERTTKATTSSSPTP